MALINPDIEGYKKWVQQIVNRYHNHLSSIRTEWEFLQDSDGDVIAAYPKLHIDFKKGSDVVEDILKNVDTTFAGELVIDGEYTHGSS